MEIPMAMYDERLSSQWRDAGNLLLGLWLAISPWLLSYAGEATPAWNAHAVGVIIAVAALAAFAAFQEWEEWVNVALGAWLVISSYLLGFSNLAAAFWNQLIVGLLVVLLAAWTLFNADDLSVKT
jgi:hypothetical protein